MKLLKESNITAEEMNRDSDEIVDILRYLSFLLLLLFLFFNSRILHSVKGNKSHISERHRI